MMELETLVVSIGLIALAGFSTFRSAQFVVYDEGPAGLMLRLRERAGVYDLGENGLPVTDLGRGLDCTHCVGLWIALLWSLLLFHSSPVFMLLAWWAIAGIQSLLEGRGQ